jgi:hypothetical protein
VIHSPRAILLLGFITLAFSSADAQVKPPTSAPTVDTDVKTLQTGSDEDRQGAQVRLYALPPDQFPALEKASKRTDLKPEVSDLLKKIVEQQRPLVPLRKRAQAARDAGWHWAQRTMLRAYDTAGKRNPKWDDAARTGIQQYWDPSVEPLARFEAVDAAMQKGCSDPMLRGLYFISGANFQVADPKSWPQDYRAVTDAVERGAYPTVIKFYFELNLRARIWQPLLGLNGRHANAPDADARAAVAKVLELWTQVVKDPDVPRSQLVELAEQIVGIGSRVDNDPKPTFDAVLSAMDAREQTRAAAQLFKGVYHARLAWSARGAGWARDVKPEAWKVMGDNLNVAEDALSRAWDLAPDDVQIPMTMLSVELGQARGRDVLETWFLRAMKADPDNFEACREKLNYLAPKWHGSADEMLSFARECKDSNNWYARLPLLLPEAHFELARYAPSPTDYLKQDRVWADVMSVYGPLLAAWPDDAKTRSRFTYIACACGRWAEARRQFDRLGDKAVPDAFGDDSRMEDLRQKAMNGGR